MQYSHFKPFTPTSAGGTIKGVTKATAKAIIKRKKLQYSPDKYGFNERAVRRFATTNSRETITFYL